MRNAVFVTFGTTAFTTGRATVPTQSGIVATRRTTSARSPAADQNRIFRAFFIFADSFRCP